MYLAKDGNKKGFAPDLIFLLVMAFVFIIAFYVVFQFITTIVNSNLADGSPETIDLRDKVANVRGLFDGLFVLFYFGTIFGIAIVSFRLRVSPAFLFGLWLLLTLLIIVAKKFSDVFSTLTSQGFFADIAGNFPIANHIMANFALYYWLSATLIMAVMFGIGRSESK